MLTTEKFESALSKLPVVAIIRGVGKEEVVEIAEAIYEAGIRIIEVPLNTPNAFECIERLAANMKSRCVVGCGTLVNIDDVSRLVDAGGELAVTPTTQIDVITACIDKQLITMPGWMTPSEAFSAVRAGTKHLKLFPASTAGIGHVKAVKAVLPQDINVFAVGGVRLDELALWKAAGVSGFGFGSDIYSAGISANEVSIRSQRVVEAVRQVL